MLKKDRLVLILAGLLLVQSILLAVVYWPRPTQATGGALLPTLAANDISELTITDNEGAAITLARQGDAWILASAGDFPVRADTVTTLIDKLTGVNTNRLIAETAASHARLQVASGDFVRRLDLKTSAGDVYTVYLGSQPAAGATHVRLNGHDQVYQTGSLAAFDASASPSTYIDTSLVSIPAGDVTAMSFKNANGEMLFDKGDDGQWSLAGLAPDQTLDAGLVQTLLNQATAITMVEPLGKEANPAWGMDSPQAIVSLSTQPAAGEGKTYELRIGAKDEATNRYYVKFSESPYYVTVAAFSLDDFVNKGLSGFVATPTPAPAPAE